MTPENIIVSLAKVLSVALCAYWAIAEPLQTAIHFVAFMPVILLCRAFWGGKTNANKKD
ncbi:MAG: hypothetical protein ABF675_05655 [Zymomonas mobilis]|uniref:hypothetical protein n=1 Tax=Zymomonas mobilis TaxID=542 RepID=UPI0039ED939B